VSGGVAHDAPEASWFGGTVEIDEWRLPSGRGVGECVLIDAGYASREEGDPSPWRWWLVQNGGKFYVGLPGLEAFRRISPRTRLDGSRLDGVILKLLEDHGI
jgi:hypothetical protein